MIWSLADTLGKLRMSNIAAAKAMIFCFALTVLPASMAPKLRAEDLHSGGSVIEWTVLDMGGQLRTYRSAANDVTVVMFFSTRCPMSNAFNYRRNLLYREFGKRVHFFVIDSNSNESIDEVRDYAREVRFDFPVYLDVNTKVADQFRARNTTETFVLDGSGIIRYRGYIEDAPNPDRTTKQGLRLAIKAILAGQQVDTPETHGIGCAIRRAH